MNSLEHLIATLHAELDIITELACLPYDNSGIIDWSEQLQTLAKLSAGVEFQAAFRPAVEENPAHWNDLMDIEQARDMLLTATTNLIEAVDFGVTVSQDFDDGTGYPMMAILYHMNLLRDEAEGNGSGNVPTN